MARKYRHFVYDENQKFIYPTSDWGFKYLLGSERNKDLLMGILNELLPDLHIESLDFLPQRITIPIEKMRDVTFDIYCKLNDGSHIVVEMQNYVKITFIDRMTVYTSAAVLENYVNSKAKDYRIGKTITIAFTGDPVFKDVSRTPIRVSPCDIDEEKTTVRNPKVLQIFVELPKFAGELQKIDADTPFVEKFAYVMMEMADCKEIPDNLNDPLLERLFQEASVKDMQKEDKENYMKSIMGEAEYEANLYEWREEGLAEGLAKGQVEGKRAAAAMMRKEGVAIEIITKCTGLSQDEVEGLDL